MIWFLDHITNDLFFPLFILYSGPTPVEVAQENDIKQNITKELSTAVKKLQQEQQLNSDEPILRYPIHTVNIQSLNVEHNLIVNYTRANKN